MKTQPHKVSESSQSYYELEVIPGLADFARTELDELTVGQAQSLPGPREDRVRFRYAAHPARLLHLRRSVAVSQVKRFDIPRPKALLGHQNFEALIRLIGKALALHKPASFKTFRINAAGSESTVFARVKEQVAVHTGLEYEKEAGDLLLTVRRPQRLSPASASNSNVWEVAVRLSPRPLGTRPWRACNMPGALNGTVASVMMGLTHPSAEDRVINLACGSGTLLIERLLLGPAQSAVGCDIDAAALDCARTNIVASGHANKVALLRCDAGRAPLLSAWATTVCVDLPFGMLLGSHQSNAVLYPRLLAEAGRLTLRRGWLVAITQELRLFQRVASEQADQWRMVRQVPIKLPASTRSGTIRPRIYLLQRR